MFKQSLYFPTRPEAMHVYSELHALGIDFLMFSTNESEREAEARFSTKQALDGFICGVLVGRCAPDSYIFNVEELEHYTTQDAQSLNGLKHCLMKVTKYVDSLKKSYPNSIEAQEVKHHIEVMVDEMRFRRLLPPELEAWSKQRGRAEEPPTSFLKHKQTREVYAVWTDKTRVIVAADGPYDQAILTPRFLERWRFERKEAVGAWLLSHRDCFEPFQPAEEVERKDR
jgi:hypothetical protein